MASDNQGIKSLEQFATEFGLEEDDYDDIEEEIINAVESWRGVFTTAANETKLDIKSERSDGSLTRLLKPLKMNFVRKDHEKSFLVVAPNGELGLPEFVDWYVFYCNFIS